MTDFTDRDAGAKYEEGIHLLMKIESCLHGHSREIALSALIHAIASTLRPATAETRSTILQAIPVTIRYFLNEMDRMIQRGA